MKRKCSSWVVRISTGRRFRLPTGCTLPACMRIWKGTAIFHGSTTWSGRSSRPSTTGRMTGTPMPIPLRCTNGNNMRQESQYMRRRALRDRLVFAIKVVLWLLIAYSFAVETPLYRTYPRLEQIAYGVNTFLTVSVVVSIGRFTLISLYRRQNQKNNRVRGNYIL